MICKSKCPSPEVTLFTRFCKNFELLPHGDDWPLAQFNVANFNEPALTMIEIWRHEALQILQTENNFKRDDYLEFVELCTLFLRSQDAVKSTKFNQPGALHKARWMVKRLYGIKTCLLEAQISQLPPGTITTGHQVPKVRDFIIFATLIYSPWWMTCTSATDAPWHDLNLFYKLLMYEVVNPAISSSAIKALKHHLWYLTGEMVSLALFSDKVPTDEQRAFANQPLTVKPAVDIVAPWKRLGSSFGKPKVPKNITSATSLADLVNENSNSWFTLHILQVNTDFLTEDVNDWSNSSAYQEPLANDGVINVINDCAKRGVKLSADFLCVARDEQHYQNVLQVVEQARKNMPNLKKRKSNPGD